jgi:hypothetical protein
MGQSSSTVQDLRVVVVVDPGIDVLVVVVDPDNVVVVVGGTQRPSRQTKAPVGEAARQSSSSSQPGTHRPSSQMKTPLAESQSSSVSQGGSVVVVVVDVVVVVVMLPWQRQVTQGAAAPQSASCSHSSPGLTTVSPHSPGTGGVNAIVARRTRMALATN